MIVPTKHRDALKSQCEGRLTLTRHPDGCLLMFPRPVWEIARAEIAKWPLSVKRWQRMFLGNASDVELDGAGRLLISPELREAVGLAADSTVKLVGMATHFEIWDAAAHATMEDATIAGGFPEELKHFSF
jgi:MraZ protein